MPASEFELIDKYFRTAGRRADVRLPIGDDAAVLALPPGKHLVLTTDTLVAGVHFPLDTPAQQIACKAVAVNLSDLAAMGAEPAWLTLALTLPQADENWLQAFAREFLTMADSYGVELVGGDTTQGPLNICVTAMGLVDNGRLMRRDSARAGDAVYVTGTLGDAAIGLDLLQRGQVEDESSRWLLTRLHRPEPRVDFALLAVECCDCAIDISDGLAADLGHVLAASGCGARLCVDDVPLSQQARGYFDSMGGIDWNRVLTGGDDYELCVIAAPANEPRLMQAADQSGTRLSRIGEITRQPGLVIVDHTGRPHKIAEAGFEHFSAG